MTSEELKISLMLLGYKNTGTMAVGYIWQVMTNNSIVEHRKMDNKYIIWLWDGSNILVDTPEEVLAELEANNDII